MTASTATSGKLTLSISSVGVKMYINPWKYGADVDRGMDVYVEVKSGFKCGSVMGLCGNFNCKSSDDKPEAKRSSPKNAVPMGGDSICTSPAPPPRPAGDLCTSDAKLKATATALCSKFKGDTQKQCIGDICLTGKTPFVNAAIDKEKTEFEVEKEVAKNGGPPAPPAPPPRKPFNPGKSKSTRMPTSLSPSTSYLPKR